MTTTTGTRNTMPIKTRRIQPGEYEGTYKGHTIRVVKMSAYDENNRDEWWNIVIDDHCDDGACTKRDAILDAMDLIDQQTGR